MGVISVDEFRKRAYKEINISGFNESDEDITILVKHVSLVGMLAKGKIPNSLMSTAENLFRPKNADGSVQLTKQEKEEQLQESLDTDVAKTADMSNILDLIIGEVMVQPKFEEVSDVITDKQKMEIFAWTQKGISKLTPTDRVEESNKHSRNMFDLPEITE